MSTVLETVFAVKPDLRRFVEMLADEGKSAEYITRSLNEANVKISVFPVKTWLREYRKAKTDTEQVQDEPPTKENEPHVNRPGFIVS